MRLDLLCNLLLTVLALGLFVSHSAQGQDRPCISKELIGHFDTEGTARQVCVKGNVALVADNTAGLHIIDISVASQPVHLATFSPGPAINDVVAIDNSAYVVGVGGLYVLDISNPSTPVVVGTYETSSVVNEVDVDGSLVYLAIGYSGLEIVSIEHPSTPAHVGYVELIGDVNAVIVAHPVAYVSAGLHGFQVIDVSNPALPALVTTTDTPGSAKRIEVFGNTAYVVDTYASSGIQIFDITDPFNPVGAGSFQTGGSPYEIRVDGTTGYVGDSRGVQLVEFDTPFSTKLIHRYSTPRGAFGLVAHNNVVYAVDSQYGLLIIDFSSPGNIDQPGAFDTTWDARDVVVQNQIAFLVDSISPNNPGTSGKLVAIDLSEPDNPVYVSEIDLILSNKVVMIADHAVVGGRTKRLYAIDVTKQNSMELVSIYELPSSVSDFDVVGNVVFCGLSSGGFYILDYTNPLDPAELGSYPYGNVEALYANQDTLMVAHNTNVIKFYDVANLTSPIEVGEFVATGRPTCINISGTSAYVGVVDHGVIVLDISTPSLPAQIGQYQLPDTPKDIVILNDYAYIAADDAGLYVLDVSTPESPQLIDSFPVLSPVVGVCVSEGYQK